MKYISNKKNSAGFTLMEVLIATFVLMVGVVGSFDLIRSAFYNVSLNEDKLTASYLSAEGIEIVRNIRDNNFEAIKNGSTNVNWDNGISDGTYCVDSAYISVSGVNCGPLHLSDANGFSYAAGDPVSKFSRDIIISHDTSNPRILVKSKVSWNERNQNYSIEANDYLYNWY